MCDNLVLITNFLFCMSLYSLSDQRQQKKGLNPLATRTTLLHPSKNVPLLQRRGLSALVACARPVAAAQKSLSLKLLDFS